MAKNDWIVAGLNNPEFTSYDFSTIADMDLTNTQMLSADEYLKSDFIKNHDLFKDDTGSFSEAKFRKYHQKRLDDFEEFKDQEFFKGPQLDMFDTDRTADSRVKDIQFSLGRNVNPDRQAVGIEGVRLWSDPEKTKSELAQSQKIWDTKNQEFKDYSSNDKALSNGVFNWLEQVMQDPLVMAQWEEDGEHVDPITGITVAHKKGEYKLNDKGTYYYETLGDRSPIGKEVLSVFDTLTVDGQGINKYDFFDSDDVKKSVGGVIAKNVAVMLPMFASAVITGPVGAFAATAYSTLFIARELGKSLPMLYGWMTALSDTQEAPKWINKIAATGTKFTGGTSQYAKENTFSFENFGNLISDVALQWGQQKAIAGAFNKVRGVDEYLKTAKGSVDALFAAKSAKYGATPELYQACYNSIMKDATKTAHRMSKLGRDASLVYMAVISNSDVYSDLVSKGLTNKEAAAVSLGSTLGMFSLNKYTGLGEIFFDDATDDVTKLARKSIKDEMNKAVDMFKSITKSNEPEPNKYLKLIRTASNKTKEIWSKFGDDLQYHTLNFAGKAVGEGLEEVSEELISDVAKQIYELAGVFGADTSLKDIGAWDNALERYTMSFLGGAVGGGIFYGKDALMTGKSYKEDSKNWEIAHLIRNGYAGELRAEIEKRKAKGELGNVNLSASKFELNANGDRVWLTTDNKKESQNDAIANAMIDKINALEAVIVNNNIGLSDDQLFENMILTEERYKRYEKISGLTNYYQDFANITNNLISAELNLKAASNTEDGTVDGEILTDRKLTPEQESARKERLKLLQEEVDKFRKQKDEFLSGNTSLDYTRKLNFIIDPRLHSQFLSIDEDQFFREKYGDRDYEDLNDSEKLQFRKDWYNLVSTTLKTNVDKAWTKYKEVESLLIPDLHILGEHAVTYKKFLKDAPTLLGELLDTRTLKESYVRYGDRLEGESDEEYNNRDTKLKILTTAQDELGNDITVEVEESDDEYATRRYKREKLINEINEKKDQEWVDRIMDYLQKLDYKVDPYTYRYILRSLPHRKRDVVSHKIAYTQLNPKVRAFVKDLKSDFSNLEEIKQKVRDLVAYDVTNDYTNLVKDIMNSNIFDGSVNQNLLDFLADKQLEGDEDDELSISDVINDSTYQNEENKNLIELLEQLQAVAGEDFDLNQLLTRGSRILEGKEEIARKIDQEYSIQENVINSLISNIQNSPVYQLMDSIKKTVKNPIGELVKSLSQKNGDVIPNIDELLHAIQNEYDEIDYQDRLILDDSQLNNLQKVRSYLKLIDGYIYAAASKPEGNITVGHNQVINEFAKTHKDSLISDWEVLPEIDSDYLTTYSQSILQYINEADGWIRMSNNNSINKIRKFIATDTAFTKSLLDSIKSRNLKVTFDDKEINLLDGFIDGDESVDVNLFNAEQSIYRNFQKALKENGVSAEEFLSKTKLLEQLVPSISNISKQEISSLDETISSEKLTDFDLLQYYAQILSSNPSEFYSELKSRVTNNTAVAPITAQEYSSKLAKAITTPTYRAIMKYAHEKSGSKLPFLGNTLIVTGSAGTGKTSVVLASANNPDEEVIVSGPTKDQAYNLSKSLNRDKFHTFEELLPLVLGKDQWDRIKAEYDQVKDPTLSDSKTSFEYFDVKIVDRFPVIQLKSDKLVFNKTIKPKKIFLDEATHLSSLQLQILDKFAESVGGVVYAAGDPNQKGHIQKDAGLESFQESSVFASRAFNLSISLRDDNLQKYLNQEKVRSYVEDFKYNTRRKTKAELKLYYEQLIQDLDKLRFKVYNHEELNGDLITSSLSDELIEKLRGKTIGFIGEQSSPYYIKLKEAGLNPTLMSMDTMQGREFNYVIVDRDWKMPEADYNGVKTFLTDLYTTMTRATTASIFIDNGLSSIIGSNEITNNKSKAPSIAKGVEELRNNKLAILDKFKLDLSSDSETPKTEQPVAEDGEEGPDDGIPASDEEEGEEGEGEQVENNEELESEEAVEEPEPSEESSEEPEEIVPEEEHPTGNPHEDFQDPDQKNIDSDLIKGIKSLAVEDEKQLEDSNLKHFAKDGEQIVECFTDITILSAEKSEPQERTVKRMGKEYTLKKPVWTIRTPKSGVARNLQAFYDPGTTNELIFFDDKERAQKKLFDIKSAIAYQHDYSDLPTSVKNHIDRKSWEEGTLEIEIREPSTSDTKHLNAYKTKEERDANVEDVGINVNGKKYIVNVVFKVKLTSGLTAKFDIAGLPDLDNYFDNLGIIKNNLRVRINKATGPEKEALQRKLDNTDITFAHYKELMRSWINRFEEYKSRGESSFVPVQLDDSNITFNKTTWLQPFSGLKKKKGIQLGGLYNPVTQKRADYSLMLNHPELVFSPVYTYASKKALLEKVDPSIKGKAIIFVTSDTLLDKDQLVDEYMKQKQNPNGNTARVRMLVLNNYGMRFSQLVDRSFIDKFQKGDNDRKPFRQNFTGIRMYTALWNWRAGLIKFDRALRDWMNLHNYDEKQVEVLTQADQLLYDAYESIKYSDKQDKEEAALKLLVDNGLSGEDLENLRNFNNIDCADIPTFRLGYSRNGKGFYVRGKFDLTKSSLYNKDANLLAITPQKASQFLYLTTRIVGALEKSDKWGAFTLGSELLKGDKTSWKIDELINIDNAKHVRTLSGLLSREGETLLLGIRDEEGSIKEVAYAQGEHWSMIPALIANITRTVTYFQNHPDALQDRDGDLQQVKTTIGDKENKQYVMTQIGDFFSKGYLQFGNDPSLFEMFDLAFHGTHLDVHTVPKKGESFLQLEDAYFKHGFFINPDAVREYDPVRNDYHLEAIEDAGGNAIFFAIATSPELFTVDTDVRTSGIGLRIEELFDKKISVTTSVGENSEINEETIFKTKYPQLSAYMDSVNNLGQDFAYNLNSVEEAIVWNNEKNLRNLKVGIESGNEGVLDYPYKDILNGDHLVKVSLRDHIKAAIGTDVFDIDISSTFKIKAGDSTYTMNENFEIIKDETSSTITTTEVESKYDGLMDNGKSIKDNLLEALENDDILDAIVSKGDVSRDDLDPLYNTVAELFDSGASDSEIKDALNQLKLENVAYAKFATYIKINEKYVKLHEALMNC